MEDGIHLSVEISRKIQILASQRSALQEDVERLRAENEALLATVRERESDLERLLEQFNVYKTAVAVAGKSGSSLEAKRRIRRIIQEVDKCLALINVQNSHGDEQ